MREDVTQIEIQQYYDDMNNFENVTEMLKALSQNCPRYVKYSRSHTQLFPAVITDFPSKG